MKYLYLVLGILCRADHFFTSIGISDTLLCLLRQSEEENVH